MKSLNAGDPIAKLYSDFTKTITKESKDLLTAPGHKAWLAQINADGKTADQIAELQTTALIHQLETGQGINKKNLADLEKRYGETIPGHRSSCSRTQLDDLHEHEDRVDEEDDRSREQGDHEGSQDDRRLRSADQERSRPRGQDRAVRREVPEQGQVSGFLQRHPMARSTVGDAFEQLKARMIAAIAPGDAMHDQLREMGISGERLIQILEAISNGFAYRDREQGCGRTSSSSARRFSTRTPRTSNSPA
jgi:hypothetical protein